MTNLGKQISKACTALGMPVELDFALTINGTEVRTVARIPDLGGRKGMLIIPFGTKPDLSKQLVADGYGVSHMFEPDDDSSFDLESWCETFCDWGWTGDPARKPKMMSEPPLDELKDDLLHAEHDTLKEQAARKIATIHWEVDESQEILFDALHAGQVSGEMQEACITALADIWIRRGEINRRLYDQLDSVDLKEILAPWFEEVKKEMSQLPARTSK